MFFVFDEKMSIFVRFYWAKKGLYETDKGLLKKYALVLYEQARLLEGLSIEDVGGFVSAMSDIM